MQIVIDMPEEVREHIFDLANDGNEIPLGINAHMVKAIVNGTPLPKEHGKLIDADAFAIRGEYLEKLYGSDFYWEFKKQLDKAPTIIEADKRK